MIEAVNSTLQASQVTRAVAEQTSTSESLNANPDGVQRIARAPYISPAVDYNYDYNQAVLVLRDSDTGDVVEQIPSETRLAEQARTEAQSFNTEVAAPAQRPNATAEGTGSPAPIVVEQPQTEQRQVEVANVQQIAAFEAAARSGNSNAGTVTLFA